MVGLGAISGLVVFVVTANLLSQFRTYSLVIAAGNAQGESYIISTALAEVVEKYNSRIRLTVQETGGTRYRDWETDRKSTRLNSSH